MAKAKAKNSKVADESLGKAGMPGEDEVNSAASVSKDTNSIEATGKFEVAQISEGKFRMFNELGQAVSPVVSKEDKLENGKPALAKLVRDAHRSNALRRARHITTPKGHADIA